MNDQTSPRKRPRPYPRTGFCALKRAVTAVGSRALPSKATALGRELREWHAALIKDLVCETTITTQQRALLFDSVDAYILAMPSPVNRQRRCLHPILRERLNAPRCSSRSVIHSRDYGPRL